MKNTILWIICVNLLSVNLGFAQNSVKLEQELTQLLEEFDGRVGLYVKHLESGEEVSYQADSIFPTASIVKIPILLGVMDRIDRSELNFHQPLIYRDSLSYGGAGLMQFFKDSTQTDLRTLMALMLSYSDNTTSLWLQQLAGGGQSINQVLDNFGFSHTRVNSRTPGREQDRAKFGWGQTTPKEMAELMSRIYLQTLGSPESCALMYKLLSNTYYFDYALSSIPIGINVASKQGMVNDSRSEVFLVNSPGGNYVVSIFTKETKDQSWATTNAAWELARKVSALCWNYFNPSQPFHGNIPSRKYLEGLSY